MVLIIDAYDSFVYNLVCYIERLGYPTQVFRHDQIDVAGCLALNPSHLVLSPGPKSPDEAGICLELVEKMAGKIPILGVCLGHQVIAQAFGGTIVKAQAPMHGKSSEITHGNVGLWADLPNPLTVGRYHSLVVNPDNCPRVLKVEAWSHEGEIMALTHLTWPIWGVQFHPESVLTPDGLKIIGRFLKTKMPKNSGEVMALTELGA